MPSKFAIAGHPIHPMLVPLPIGLIVWTFVADLVYVFIDEPIWYDIAFWTGWAAVATALLAALPGFGDYRTMAVNVQPVMATWHMALNLAAVALFIVAGVLSLDRGAAEAGALTLVVALHGIAVGAVSISGWIGGEMVYRHGLAVLPQAADEVEDEERRPAAS